MRGGALGGRAEGERSPQSHPSSNSTISPSSPTANSFLMYNYIPGLSGTLSSRTRTLVAGAIISAAADM